MSFIKKNLKVIIAFIIGAALASCVAVYATTYLANDVQYTNSKTVKGALDDLYSISSDLDLTNATASDLANGKKAYTKNGLITGNYVQRNIPSFYGTYLGEFFKNSANATLTMSQVEKGEYIMVCFRTSPSSGTDPSNVNQTIYKAWVEKNLDVASITGATCTKIGENTYNLQVTNNTSNITVTINNAGSSTTSYGYIKAFLIKI